MVLEIVPSKNLLGTQKRVLGKYLWKWYLRTTIYGFTWKTGRKTIYGGIAEPFVFRVYYVLKKRSIVFQPWKILLILDLIHLCIFICYLPLCVSELYCHGYYLRKFVSAHLAFWCNLLAIWDYFSGRNPGCHPGNYWETLCILVYLIGYLPSLLGSRMFSRNVC